MITLKDLGRSGRFLRRDGVVIRGNVVYLSIERGFVEIKDRQGTYKVQLIKLQEVQWDPK